METGVESEQSNEFARAPTVPDETPLQHRFRLRLLGPLTLTRDDVQVLLPPSRKVRALLGFLALAPRPVLRSQLCELLWDVANDPRSELRWCLTKIRSAIDDSQQRRLIADKKSVGIEASGLDVDAIVFARTIERALDDGSLADLTRLLGVIDGDLLEGDRKSVV